MNTANMELACALCWEDIRTGLLCRQGGTYENLALHNDLRRRWLASVFKRKGIANFIRMLYPSSMANEFKKHRLEHWDYSNPSEYFITFCTAERKNTLGRVISSEQRYGIMEYGVHLTSLGMICESVINEIPDHFPCCELLRYSIMPNHVHLLILLREQEQRVTIGKTISYVKSKITRAAHAIGFAGQVWQKDFYDHIVRNEKDEARIIEYIDNNPHKWLDDRFYRSEDEGRHP